MDNPQQKVFKILDALNIEYQNGNMIHFVTI